MSANKYEQEKQENIKLRKAGFVALIGGLIVGILSLVFNNFEVSVGSIGYTEFVFSYDLTFFIIVGFLAAVAGGVIIYITAGDKAKLLEKAKIEKQQDEILLNEQLEKANAGDPEAQFALACRYDSGDGVIQDFGKAYNWWLKAAEQGHIAAQFNVGSMYENGEGVPKNDIEAFKWYSLSADQGYAAAMNCVGVYLKEGKSVAQNHKEALKYFQAATQKGNAWGSYNLGMAYLEGSGCEVNRELAINYLTIAANKNIGIAKAKLNELSGRL